MSQPNAANTHNHETMRRLKLAALSSHDENLTPPDEMSRRDAMRVLMGASSALALGLGGCERKPRRQIVSRASGPEYQTPGEAVYYSSTWTEGPFPYGLMIKTVDGRPIKVEGNPDHPINRGATSAAMQASVLSLYDPDRLRGPYNVGGPASWDEVDRRVVEAVRNASSVVLMTGANLGPSEREIVEAFLSVVPGAKHFVHETVHDGPRRSAWTKVYGADGEVLPRFDRAKVIVSLESDFLGTDGVVLENIRLFAEGRKLRDSEHRNAQMSRLYVAEGAMTVTGSNADQRVRVRPSGMGMLSRALFRALSGNADELAAVASRFSCDEARLGALVDDLRSHRGEALVVAGPHLPEDVHATVALLNDVLEAPGRTLEWNSLPPNQPVSDPAEVEAAFAGGTDVAILLDTNPVYDWPGADFGSLIAKCGLSVGHGLHHHETLTACSMALPSSHYLESWNDAQPRPGVVTLCQPVIAPLFDTRQAAESLLVWTMALAEEGSPIRGYVDFHDYVRDHWDGRAHTGGAGSETSLKQRWENALRAGGSFEPGDAAPVPAPNRAAVGALVESAGKTDGLEVVIRPHHAVYDGRFANNGWLQELPDPVSKIVWDNPGCMSAGTARQLDVAEGDRVSVRVGDRSVEVAALIDASAADGVVVLTLGHGRTAGGRILGEAAGANVAGLLGPGGGLTPYLALDAQVANTAGSTPMVRTQKQFSRHGRPIVLDGTLSEYRKDAGFVQHKRHVPELVTMYPEYDYSKGHKWGMAIDLSSCVGCNACVTACQAENNIPIVGRDQVAAGREMHWLRIDRYLDGEADDPVVHQQPMLCQHCDNAPCESVCPVNATAHSPEGLNEMVYNRCVGTRYCSNNCPYKVRRFNYLRYQEAQLHDPVQELAFNPQVTVRGVGVMEKCTFCVQRINEGKYRAQNKGEALADGAIKTACQQACPAGAITFGDLNDPASRVARMHDQQRAFFVLEEYNVKPNVAYLARVRNPHPSSSKSSAESHHG
ncbi:MAG: 4Fe-4S dicluster domain-containing protein [Phycisphaerae bacterium]|jgi:molybdopterin-containing oxidoreductase family iron-sulfur binding subunit